nr:hypothetical protein [Tanacetum cinerariifolium]
MTVPITYDVGGPSTDIPVGHPLTTIAFGVATQPQLIDDLCVRMSNLEYRYGELVQTLQTSLHGAWLQNQQLQTRLSVMENHEGTLISYMSWMEERRVVLEKRLTRPPTGPRWIELLSDYECEIKYHPGKGEASKDLKALAECQTENKKRAYTARHGEKKHYGRSKPLCSKCNYHHDGPCAPKFHHCNRFGHLARDCRSPVATNNHRNPTCYEYGNQGHYRSDCPELKNQEHGNQAGGTGAHGMVHTLGGGETNQDLNDVEDDINS